MDIRTVEIRFVLPAENSGSFLTLEGWTRVHTGSCWTVSSRRRAVALEE